MSTHARRRPAAALPAALLATLLAALPGRPALAQHPPIPPAASNAYYYSLPNTTGKTATDLHLTFNVAPRAGLSNRFLNDITITGMVATFDGGPGVPNGTEDHGVVSFGRRRGPFMLTKAEWSFPDLPNPGGPNLPKIPQPNIPINLRRLGIDGYRSQGATNGNGYIAISNADVASVFISNLRLAKDVPDALIDTYSNSGLAALRDNQLFLGSGTPVTPGSSSFSLAPGASVLFDLGPVSDVGHVATLFDVETSSGAMATLGLVTNDVVPEPATIALVAGGLLALAAARRRTTARVVAG